MQATLEQDFQDGAKAAAEKLRVQTEEQHRRTEALEVQIRLQHESNAAHMDALAAKHKEQVHRHPSFRYQ